MQAIAQSATQLTISNGAPDWDEAMFNASVERAASRKAAGTTRERQMLKRQTLIDTVKQDYRNHFAALYGKSEKLPRNIFEQIEKAVDGFIGKQLARVNSANVLSLRRAFHWDERGMQVTERIVTTGENLITLQEQHLGIVTFITSAEKRLKDLEAKPTPDYDREKEIKARIMRLNVTKTYIEGEIEHQKKQLTS